MSEPLQEGTVVGGKLRVVRVLGAGGMGAVYEVEHQLTKHRRALKLLHKELLTHPSIVARFQREASAAGHIGNRHIVETFDAGTLDTGEPYIVMEMLQGEALASRFMRERDAPAADLARLVDIVTQACDGVQAAHDAGIVHRDLKPDNIFLVGDSSSSATPPFVKILDFGISKFDAALLANANVMTKEGAAIGTPYYMSPEQVSGDKTLDGRTDVYALGIILYEGISGQRPFEADALPMLSVLIHQGNAKPLHELRPDLPPAFVEVVATAMATDREKRFKTARALGAALAPFGSAALDATLPETTTFSPAQPVTPPTPTPPPPPPPPPPAIAISTEGAAVSVAENAPVVSSKKKPTSRAWIGIAIVPLVFGAVAVSKLMATPPIPTIPATPARTTPATITSESVTPLSPMPSLSVAASAPPSPSSSASTKPAVPAVPAVPALKPPVVVVPASAKPIDAKGLASENPFR